MFQVKESLSFAVFVGVVLSLFALFIFAIIKNDERQERERKAAEVEQYEGPCKDESSLLATTSGSPSALTCTNKLHEMQVQVATHPSSEEAAALVFCKCRRGP